MWACAITIRDKYRDIFSKYNLNLETTLSRCLSICLIVLFNIHRILLLLSFNATLHHKWNSIINTKLNCSGKIQPAKVSAYYLYCFLHLTGHLQAGVLKLTGMPQWLSSSTHSGTEPLERTDLDFHRPSAVPFTQPTVSKYWSEQT